MRYVGNRPVADRGVFETASPPAGYREYRMIAADGTELVCVRVHTRALERFIVEDLREWLNRADAPRGV